MRWTAAVPLRDGAPTVAHVVRAALAQSPPPTRVLVCDDGSCDDGRRAAQEAGAAIVCHDRPLGLAAARNSLLGECSDEFIVYFDADAIPRPDCAAALLAGFAGAQVAAVGGRGVERGAATFADRWRAAHTPQSHGDRSLDDDWMVIGLCCAFRVAALREIGGFDPRFTDCGEDLEASLRLRARGWRLTYRPEAIVDHARSDNALGVLQQAWRHNRAAARALRLHARPAAPLREAAIAALLPALREAARGLDVPAAALSAANLALRLAATV
jgi:GT2 family glycosyltransferase